MDPLTASPRDGRLAFTCVVPVHAGDDPAHFDAAMTSIARSTLRPAAVLIAQDGELPSALTDVVRACLAAGGRGDAQPRRQGAASQPQSRHAPGRHAVDRARGRRRHQSARPLRAAGVAARTRPSSRGARLPALSSSGRTDGPARNPCRRATRSIERRAVWRSPINHNTAFVRLSAFADCGGYPTLPQKEDYGLWLTMIGAAIAWPTSARPGPGPARRRLLRAPVRWPKPLVGTRHLSHQATLGRRGGVDPARAGLAMVARAAILGAAGPARLVYEGLLRR